MVSNEAKPQHTFDAAEMGAIAHLYRGEVYRSTIWRTRLDNTTNWSIVTMGIALSFFTTMIAAGISQLGPSALSLAETEDMLTQVYRQMYRVRGI